MEALEKHFSLKVNNDVRQIANPLIDFFGLNYFAFRRIYNDGRHVVLGTSSDWIVKYYTNKYFKKKETQKFSTGTAVRPIVWDFMQKDSFSALAMQQAGEAGFYHSFTLVICENNYTELVSLSAPRGHDPSEDYLTRLDYIERFIKYFRNEALNLIMQAEKSPILTDQIIQIPGADEIKREITFLNKTNTQKLNVIVNGKIITLSKKETACARLILNGKSTKQVASLLEIKEKTAENYLDNIKKKLNCNYKTELFTLLMPYRGILEEPLCDL